MNLIQVDDRHLGQFPINITDRRCRHRRRCRRDCVAYPARAEKKKVQYRSSRASVAVPPLQAWNSSPENVLRGRKPFRCVELVSLHTGTAGMGDTWRSGTVSGDDRVFHQITKAKKLIYAQSLQRFFQENACGPGLLGSRA